MNLKFFLAVPLLVLAMPAHADPKLAPIFGDSMVLPRDKPFPIWGSADAGEEITVSMRGASVKTVADAEGKWTLQFPAQTVQATPFEVSVAGKSTLVLKDVLQGDVWLGSGQSNMVWPVKQSDNAAQEMAAAKFPLLRLKLGRGWFPTSPQNVGGFSAVAFYFARELQQNLQIPIGMVFAAVGGTKAELWTPREAFEAIPELKAENEADGARREAYGKARADYDAALKGWQTKADAAKAANLPEPEGKPLPPRPLRLGLPQGGLWQAYIAPMVPFGFKGVIWYQGEANYFEPNRYQIVFPALIGGWRTAFQNPDLPFFWMQLPGYKNPTPTPNEKTPWPFFREVQTKTQSLPNTGMAIYYDVAGGAAHSTNKLPAGKRLALLALHRVYGQKIEDSGPVFESAAIEAGLEVPVLRLKFSHAKGLMTRDGQKPGGFTLSSDGKNWEIADAQIAGETIILSAPKTKPLFARYAWAQQPSDANLENAAGLPMVSFRTDSEPFGGTTTPPELIPNVTP